MTNEEKLALLQTMSKKDLRAMMANPENYRSTIKNLLFQCSRKDLIAMLMSPRCRTYTIRSLLKKDHYIKDFKRTFPDNWEWLLSELEIDHS